MDLQEIQKRQSYLNIEMMNNYMVAFDIALSKKFINKKYFIENMMFMEATNSSSPTYPNTLLFKDKITRESLRINYDR
ncbi:hypothetical protein [uncultured Mediterranean phage uvMED]|nr:hypothetical protein [uncultured Mediterranean phage uvMED]BAR21859.1 hypothetical protein [uncultured Mediterranean phage uvMED]BAR38620.1 hypothetical protein [uncultured Mediterranean phage uvMED]